MSIWFIAAAAVALIVLVIYLVNRALLKKLLRQTNALKVELAERQKVEIALKSARDELEERVVERTADLETRHIQLNETRIALEAANDKLQKLVSVDGLTGISNRRHFDEVLEKEIRRALREEKPLTLILSDIDFFKSYNDSYGHVKGDEALKKIAGVLGGTVRRAGDHAARYGGEEFASILYGADVDAAHRFANRQRENVLHLHIPHEQSSVAKYVTISSGVASIKCNEKYTASDIVRCADNALYRAKKNGRNCVEIVTQLPGSPNITLAG